MYTVYMIFAIVIALSFITGNICLIAEHKLKGKKLTLKQGTLVDEEVL